MQVMLMRLMSKGEYLIVPKGTKFKGSGKLGLNNGKLILLLRYIVLSNLRSLELSSQGCVAV